MHTDVSHDGHGTLDEVARAAAEAGSRFVVVSEHNRLAPSAPERRHGVLIVPAIEVSSKPGHVIAFGLDRKPKDRGPAVLDAIAAEGGAAALAHPVNRRRPWTGPLDRGFAGFEALSLDSAFRDGLARPASLLLPAAALLGDPEKAGALLLRRPGEALARYDALPSSRPVALLCGVDAHGLPPYRVSFAALRLHVRLGAIPAARFGQDDRADAAAIVSAIREGQTWCSVPALGDGSGFAVRVLRAEGAPPSVEVASPVDGTLVLFRDGGEVLRGAGRRLVLEDAAPGRYRGEVLVSPGFPWEDGALFATGSAVELR